MGNGHREMRNPLCVYTVIVSSGGGGGSSWPIRKQRGMKVELFLPHVTTWSNIIISAVASESQGLRTFVAAYGKGSRCALIPLWD